jgi:predicted RNA-binding protein associated with RNAse of E/G family
MKKRPTITFKVWLDIERYNEKTESGELMDAPGSSLATFDSFEEAWDYAERVTHLADNINL